jgi:hypothetical protein
MNEYENIECHYGNKRKYRKCLKNFLNGLRQKQGYNVFKTIVKYKQLFDADNETAYQVASDLYETNKTTYPATDFQNFTNFRDIIQGFGGKTIKVMYLPMKDMVFDTDDDKDAYIELLQQVNAKDKYEYVYDVPESVEAFVNWWDGKNWDWRVSDETVFMTHDYVGKVYITESMTLTAQHIEQSYLDNETQNCIFSPLKALCEKQIDNPTIATSTQSQFKTMLKKLVKYEQIYKNGLPEKEIDDVFKKLRVKMSLKIPFKKEKHVYGVTDKKKYVLSVNYINTRLNHVEMEGQYFNDELPRMIDADIFDEVHRDLIEKNQYFIYKKRDNDVHTLQTINVTYNKINTTFDVFNTFEYDMGLNYMSLDDVYDELLSKFIRTGCHMTTSKINPFYKKKLFEFVDSYEEIDCIKAFTQFENCSHYEGFLGKVSDFRQTDRLEGIGYYLIGNIDWTNANKKLKHIQRVFDIYNGRNVYCSPELKFLMDNGATFKIKGGCWGVTKRFTFTPEMYERTGLVPNYSKWTGMNVSQNDKSYYYMNTTDTKYASHIMKECYDATYNNGVVRFSMEKDIQLHKSHISGFIYGYQRINLIEQLYHMDIDKVVRINTDGIKYLPHRFVTNPIFRSVPNTKRAGFLMDDRMEGFITNTNSCDRYDWLRFHYHFIKTVKRPHYGTEIFIGQGGSGKTHRNLIDKGLIRPLYVAPSYKLIRAKQLEYGCCTEVLANVLSTNNYRNILAGFNTLIVDEASMISDEAKDDLFKMYPNCKLIFCGDMGFQAEVVEGTEMNLNRFDNINEIKNVNYRCNDTELYELLQNIRNSITKKHHTGLKYIDQLQRITRGELLDKYKTKDIILTHKHVTIAEYNKLIDKEKYMITQSNDKYSRGEVLYEKPDSKHYEKTNAFTTHSVQGESFKENIYIDIELVSNLRLFYTAVSRAKKMEQIYLVTKTKNSLIIEDNIDYGSLLLSLPKNNL